MGAGRGARGVLAQQGARGSQRLAGKDARQGADVERRIVAPFARTRNALQAGEVRAVANGYSRSGDAIPGPLRGERGEI